MVRSRRFQDGQLQFEKSTSEAGGTTSHIPALPISGKLFTFKWMHQFPKLEKISLRECNSLSVIFDFQEPQLMDAQAQTAALMFPQLKELIISRLSKLQCLWGVPLHDIHQVQGFQNLRSLKVNNCNSLKYVITPAIARKLPQLQKIDIQSCKLIEQIVGDGLDLHDEFEFEKEKVETLVFVKLDSLILRDLPMLASICANSYHSEWPSLKYLYLDGCHQLKTSPYPNQMPLIKKDISFLKWWCFGSTSHHSFLNMSDSSNRNNKV